MVRRSLPVGVVPQPGEVLESWLGTLATRLDTTFGQLLVGIGSSIGGGVDLRRPGLSVFLTDSEATAVATSTGVEPAMLHEMTLARYDGHLVSIDRSSNRLRWSTWRPSRSRFCPVCLATSSGRWRLCWRLPWVFVCDVHGCLLEDACPACGQAQRVSPRWLPPGRVPDLQRCNWWVRHEGIRVPCGGDLRTAALNPLAEDDPLAVAHARLAPVLAGAETRFGVYARSPASSLQVLADLRVLSARMLASIDPEELDDFLEVRGSGSIGARVAALDLDLRRWGEPEVFTARAPALVTGIGIALALTVLGAESIREAGDRLRSVIGGRGARNRTATPGELRFGHLSPALEAVQLSAISSHFLPSNKLRFRTTTEFPRYPRTDGTADGVAPQAIPTALWRDWSLRLVARQRIHLDTVCSSLSTMLLIVGTRTSVTDACQHLGGAVKASQQTLVLAGFLGALILQVSGRADLARYVDPAMVVVTSAIFLPIPARLIVQGFREVLTMSPAPAIQARLWSCVREVQRDYAFAESFLRTSKVGSRVDVEVHFVVAPASTSQTVQQCDDVRADLYQRFLLLGYQPSMTVSFTADRTWAA